MSQGCCNTPCETKSIFYSLIILLFFFPSILWTLLLNELLPHVQAQIGMEVPFELLGAVYHQVLPVSLFCLTVNFFPLKCKYMHILTIGKAMQILKGFIFYCYNTLAWSYSFVAVFLSFPWLQEHNLGLQDTLGCNFELLMGIHINLVPLAPLAEGWDKNVDIFYAPPCLSFFSLIQQKIHKFFLLVYI